MKREPKGRRSGRWVALCPAICMTSRNSHKKAQKGTKTKAKLPTGAVFWSAGLLPRIVAPGIPQAPALWVGLDCLSLAPNPLLSDSK